jgi:hypothetical protein
MPCLIMLMISLADLGLTVKDTIEEFLDDFEVLGTGTKEPRRNGFVHIAQCGGLVEVAVGSHGG